MAVRFSCEMERAAWQQEKGTDPDQATPTMILAWKMERHARFAAHPAPHPSLPLARGRGMHTDMRSTRSQRER